MSNINVPDVPYFTPYQVGKVLGLRPQMMYNYVSKGIMGLKGVRVTDPNTGKEQLLISRETVLQFVENRNKKEEDRLNKIREEVSNES
jgi:hypothetical protein